jgi:hypothetical protein
MKQRLSKHVVGWLALIAACTFPIAAHATSVSGTVVNASVWLNNLPPPGDGLGKGAVKVGVWGGTPGATVVGSPIHSSTLAPVAALPQGAGPFLYFLGGALPDGNYYVIAWIDGGNTPDGMPNPGEPRCAAYAFTIAASNAVWGANVEINDDGDGDKLPDYWEVHYFANLNQSAYSDYDGDGLLNIDEFNHPGLNPANWDTDGDGMDDKWELDRPPLDPTTNDGLDDEDGDGVLNVQEYRGVDGEGIIEQDPAKALGIGRPNPGDSGDAMNPLDADTDSDGLIDSFECAWYDPANGINPVVAGNPNADPDQDGLSNFREQCLLADFREGGTHDYVWFLGPAYFAGSTPVIFSPPLALGVSHTNIVDDLVAFRNHAWTDPTEMDGYTQSPDYGHDTDGDFLPDGWEVEHNLNPTSGWMFVTSPTFAWNPDGFFGDPDGDGLINYEEYTGQDEDRASNLPYVNGTGDETNPNEYNWTARDFGAWDGRWTEWFPSASTAIPYPYRALPYLSVGADDGFDTDDDGIDDLTEIVQEYPPGSGLFTASPVHSMSTFKHLAAFITATNGIAVPDREHTATYPGYTPFIHTRDWTIECYVKALGTNLTGTLIHCGGPAVPVYSNRVAYSLGLSNNIPYVAFNTLSVTKNYFQVSGLAIPSNRWIHLAGVWSHTNNSLSLYVGGIFVSQQQLEKGGISSLYFDSALPPTIGASPPGNGSFTNRLLVDEVRIWAVPRAAQEIETYRQRLVPHYPPNTSLLAYYRFDDGGTTAEDFAHKAKSSLLGADPLYSYVGDHGYALPTTGFAFTNDAAPLLGMWATAADDSDGDGLPDDWEMINHFDMNSAASPNGPNDDPDGDGLINRYEFLARCNPNAADTDQDGVYDADEDLDGDGIANLSEQTLGSLPDSVDTDDDGVTDKEEQALGTNPADPLDPVVPRAIRLAGGAADYLEVPVGSSQRLSRWSIEAWVNPDTDVGNSGTILRRTVQAIGSQYAMNYVLGLDNTVHPYAGYVAPSNSSSVLITNIVFGTAIPTGTWTHLAATFDIGTLRLYTNGVLSAAANNLMNAPPQNGKGGDTFVRIGEDFAGGIDELRLWNVARSQADIARSVASQTVEVAEAPSIVHDFRFDDGQANTNAMPFGPYHQPKGLQDLKYPRDWMDQWIHSARIVGTANTTTNSAIVPPPSLQVIIMPPEVVTNGAAWNMDGGMWYDSGHLAQNLSTGSVRVSFKPVDGWTSPDPTNVVLTKGENRRIIATYSLMNGSTIAGQVWNSSTATNYANHGQLMVGVWDSRDAWWGYWYNYHYSSYYFYEVFPISDPLNYANLTNDALPIAEGPYAFEFTGLEPEYYLAMAWIDYNNNGKYDPNEPRSYGFPLYLQDRTKVTLPPLEVSDDLDNDGLLDAWEIDQFHDLISESKNGDPDNDGLYNYEEMNLGTNPQKWDTDHDGMDDKWESKRGTNPNVDDALSDPDGDGLPNIIEYRGIDGHGNMMADTTVIVNDVELGKRDLDDTKDDTNPLNVDTDGDGLIDSFETAWYDPANGIDPLVPGDPTADPDEDGLSNFREQCLNYDLAEGGTVDIWSRAVHYQYNLGQPIEAFVVVTNLPAIFSPGLALGVAGGTVQANLAALRNAAHGWTDPTGGTGYDNDHDPAGPDTDGDGLPDGWEVEYGLDPRDPTGDNGFFGDPDGDGLINYEEYLGQDGERSSALPFVNGTGDETNPNDHFWALETTETGPGMGRPVVPADFWSQFGRGVASTLGGAAPTTPLGWDNGADTDDDGLSDSYEIQNEYFVGGLGSSPVHSMSPFVHRAVFITSAAGLRLPDPEGGIRYPGYRPTIHSRDWTIECYVKLVGADLSGALIQCLGPTQTPQKVSFELGLSNSVPYTMFDTIATNNSRYRVTGLVLPTNRWIHLAGVWSHTNNSLGLYVDGIFVQEQRIYEEALSYYKFSVATNPLLAVSADGSFANALYLDEVRIWNLARTPAQIETYRTRLLPTTLSATNGLATYFRFDDGGTTAEDFARKAKNSLIGATSEDYLYGDFGYALATNGFAFTNDAAPILGVAPMGADDSDGDGLPDDWEMINHLDPYSAASPNGAGDDPDGDGLSNLYEFYSQTNPHARDTDQDGIADGNEDLDGDGVVNFAEQLLGSRPDIVDTDDDGYTDREEQSMGTNPANSLDPLTPRSVQFGGTAGDYLEIPINANQRLFSWTIEAWVKPDIVGGGIILRRTVQAASPTEYAMNYVLGLDAASGPRPYAGFVVPTNSSPSLITNIVYGTAIPVGSWTHLAASFDVKLGVINLYANGVLIATLTDLVGAPPVNGKGGDTFVRIGEGFDGAIDDTRLWNVGRTGAEILGSYDKSVSAGETNKLVHYLRFDDGEATTASSPWSKYHQPHGIQDFQYPMDWMEEWKHAAVRHGVTTVLPVGAFIPPPSLRVILDPVEIRTNGAQWNVDLGPWNDSGTVVDNLTPGPHTLYFRNIGGWTAPATDTISLPNGMATTLTYAYVRNALGVSGTVLNGSRWVNGAFPGDGTGTGMVLVAMWPVSGGGPVGVSPGLTSNLTGLAAMPLTNGPFSFAMGEALSPGDYYVMAWVDGNNNVVPDLGEPRSLSHSIFLAQTNSISVGQLRITDDIDDDGLPDYWEVQWFGDLSHSATGQDEDHDGLSNEEELNAGLNPMNFDSDGDGMDDYWEFHNKLNAGAPDGDLDSDGDGLPNLLEYLGMDGEPRMEQDPLGELGVGRINPRDHDDALNPMDIDTDSDGLIDSFEAAWYDPINGMDPKKAGDPYADSDGDGLSNFREQCLHTNLEEFAANDIWSRPVIIANTATGTYAYVFVTNLPAIFAPALNLGVTTATNIVGNLNILRSHSWTDPTPGTGFDDFTDPNQPGDDTDGDLLPDGWEVEFGLDPRDANPFGDNGYWGDPDGDGLINFQEYCGQDGNPATGDETNPNVHFWRTLSTERGPGAGRPRIPWGYWGLADKGVNSVLGSAPPGMPMGWDDGLDSDDDGLTDSEEMQQEYYGGTNGTSPVHSMSPFIRRAALVTNASGIPVPDPEGGIYYLGYRPDFHRRDWTIECYVKFLHSGMTGALIRCGGPGPACVAFELGLSNDVPYVTFDTIGDANPAYRVTGLALVTNRWTHVAGVWDHSRNTLGLYVDGIFASEQRVYEEALSGYLFDAMEQPVIGASPDSSFVNALLVDEVRIWRVARAPNEIEAYRTHLVNPSNANLVAYYRFDDGGITAEDFARRAQSSLLSPHRPEYLFGDHGFALFSGFSFTNDAAPVLGVSQLGADDSDGDGMPDDWEMINHLDPFSTAYPNGAGDDPDGDGLSNLYEFYSQTNPHAQDTDQDGIADGNEDLDGDGVVNLAEQLLGSRPDIVDTDDDGYADNQEVAMGTDPANAGSPMIQRGMQFGGAPTDYLEVPIQAAQRLSSWTIEAWVNPTNTGSGTILRRTVQAASPGEYAMNYVLGLDAATVPYAGFVVPTNTSPSLITNFVHGVALPLNTWTHLAASFDIVQGSILLYTNGALCATCANVVGAPPVNGKGGDTFVRMGEDLDGQLDEVRLWGTARTAVQIANTFNRTEDGSTNSLVHNFRFNDGEANTNLFPWGPYHRPEGVQDFVYPRDWNDQWRHAARRVGSAQFVVPGAFTPPPSLMVILEPPEAVLAGARWNCVERGTNMLTSGALLENFIPGQYHLQYQTVYGWTEPPNETITLTNGAAHVITRTYTRKATLTVNLGPALAIAEGAKWKIDGGEWKESGTTVSNLSAAAHTNVYVQLGGWVSPSDETLTLLPGENRVITRIYERPSIVVTIKPDEAIAAGAQWNLDGGPWTNSGAVVTAPIGVHTVNFSAVTGWISPANVVTQLTGTANTSVTGTYYIVSSLGSSGTAVGYLKQPRGIAFNSLRQLYVADSGNHRVQRYDLALKTWTAFGSLGSGVPYGTNQTNTYFNTPYGICVDNSDNLFVADMSNHRVQRRDAASGQWTVVAGGVAGTNANQFNYPRDVAVDSVGSVYVADYQNHRIQKRTGTTWQTLIGNGTNAGKVYFPLGIAVVGTNLLYVTDGGNTPGELNRVQTFLTNGQHVALIGNYEATRGGLRRPGGLTVSSNTVYLADTDNNRVTTYDLPSAKWTPLGLATNYFNKPEDAAPQLRWLFVSDTMNHRIVQFVIDYGPPTIWRVPSVPVVTEAWDAIPGRKYDLEYTTDLVNWFPVAGATNLPGVNAVMTGQDTSPTAPALSYRVRVH